MNVPAVVVINVSRSRLAVLEYRTDVLAKKISRALGRILAAERLNAVPEWCDYLDVHRVSEFSEPLAPIDRHDEPLFARTNPVRYPVVCYGALPTAVATIEDKGIREVYNLDVHRPIYRQQVKSLTQRDNLSSNGMSRDGSRSRLHKSRCMDCSEIVVDVEMRTLPVAPLKVGRTWGKIGLPPILSTQRKMTGLPSIVRAQDAWSMVLVMLLRD